MSLEELLHKGSLQNQLFIVSSTEPEKIPPISTEEALRKYPGLMNGHSGTMIRLSNGIKVPFLSLRPDRPIEIKTWEEFGKRTWRKKHLITATPAHSEKPIKILCRFYAWDQQYDPKRVVFQFRRIRYADTGEVISEEVVLEGLSHEVAIVV